MHVWEFIEKAVVDFSFPAMSDAVDVYIACFDRQVTPLLKRTPNRKRWKNLYVAMRDWADDISRVGVKTKPPFASWGRAAHCNHARLKAAFWQILLQVHHRKRWHVFREPDRFSYKGFSLQNYFTVLHRESPEYEGNLSDRNKALQSLHRNHTRLERLIRRYPKRIQRTIREFQNSALGEYF
jgi:hypothetical protein